MDAMGIAQIRKQFSEYSAEVFHKVVNAVDANHDRKIDADDAFEAWGAEITHDEALDKMGLGRYHSSEEIDYRNICQPGLIFTGQMPSEGIPGYCAGYEGFTFEDAEAAVVLWQSLGLFIQDNRSVIQEGEAAGLFPLCRQTDFDIPKSQALFEIELKGEKGRSESDLISVITVCDRVSALPGKYKNISIRVEGVATQDGPREKQHRANLKIANRRAKDMAGAISQCLSEMTARGNQIKVEPVEYAPDSWKWGYQAPFYGEFPGARARVYGEKLN